MEYNYDTEKKDALIRLREKTIAEIEEIDSKLQRMRDEIGDQLAIIELYNHRSVVKDHSGYQAEIHKAITKANELEAIYNRERVDLERHKRNLEFNLESLNELLV